MFLIYSRKLKEDTRIQVLRDEAVSRHPPAQFKEMLGFPSLLKMGCQVSPETHPERLVCRDERVPHPIDLLRNP